MSLICSNLSFFYGERSVLIDIDFKVETGVFCALLGRNGSGKTTLLHCLNGLLKPRKGRIEIDGLDVGRADRKSVARIVGLVPQDHVEIFPFKVLDVVVMGRTAYLGFAKGPGREDYEAALDILDMLHIADLAERGFNQISGGERQMILLARALLQSTDTLLLDEPTNHLDFKNQYVFLDRIKGFCRGRGTRVIVAMHDPNLARLFADQVVMIKEGRVLAEGAAPEVMDSTNVTRLYDAETHRFDLPSGQQFFLPDIVCQKSRGGNASQPELIILTGPKHAGKTTLLDRFVHSAILKGMHVSGILAKGLWKNGLRDGFDLVDLFDGTTVPLARRLKRTDPERKTVFEFDERGEAAGATALSEERCLDADIVIVDEVGKLEVSGMGWAPFLRPFLGPGRPLCIWAVRKDLLLAVLKTWELQNAIIIDLEEEDPLGRLQQIVWDTLGTPP